MTRAIFVTGTDTGVGKTVITGLLARFLLSRGHRVITQKWIETGSNGTPPADIRSHLKLMQKKKEYIRDYIPYISPYTFKFASSPHLAGRLEKRRINENKIKKSFEVLLDKFDFVLIEGSGGALVPFNKKRLMIDVARDFEIPVLIVAGNKLGAINHTLLTIGAIKRRNMKIIGIIFNNQAEKTEDIILNDNPRIVRELTGERVIGVLPRVKDEERLYKEFVPIGRNVLRWMRG